MPRLSPHGSRSPLAAYPDLSEEDRSTYRRWSRAWYAGCAIFMASLLVVGLSTRTPNLRAGMQSQTVGTGAVRTAQQSHPGG
jgi:hypothetical protein